jgi:CheY-like chemotaxis protein
VEWVPAVVWDPEAVAWDLVGVEAAKPGPNTALERGRRPVRRPSACLETSLRKVLMKNPAGLLFPRRPFLDSKPRIPQALVPTSSIPLGGSNFLISRSKMNPKGSILIVDDEIGPRESLRMILKPISDIHTTENGLEAINFISQNKVDVVTLDLNMPGLSGLDVLKEIKKIQPDIEVIIVTGFGTLPNAQEAIRHGAKDFISKPFNVADVIAIVSKAFERRKVRPED